MHIPTVGRAVHFVAYTGGEHYAAVITKVWSDTCVNLVAFACEDQVIVPKTSCVRDDLGERSQTWHWPERE